MMELEFLKAANALAENFSSLQNGKWMVVMHPARWKELEPVLKEVLFEDAYYLNIMDDGEDEESIEWTNLRGRYRTLYGRGSSALSPKLT